MTTLPRLDGLIECLPTGRCLVAIAGPPGVGKSTAAEQLCQQLLSNGRSAEVVPMDGFHLDNAILDERGLRHRKGSPDTFDVDGFASLLARLSSPSPVDVAIPIFDRSRDLAIAGARWVRSDTEVIIVEGNYLLLNRPGWRDLRDTFDVTVMLDAEPAILESRLVQRWLDHGLSASDARERAESNDLPNAQTVLTQSYPADWRLVT